MIDESKGVTLESLTQNFFIKSIMHDLIYRFDDVKKGMDDLFFFNDATFI